MDKPRSPRNTGYLDPQVGSLEPQAGYPGSQASYPVPPADYLVADQSSIPVSDQPGHTQPGRPAGVPWMPAPPRPLNCPPGLEYLTQGLISNDLSYHALWTNGAFDCSFLTVNKERRPMFLIGFETQNKYEIKNSFGQNIFLAVEDTDCCTRNCWEASRPFTLRILDNTGQEVITLERPLRCNSCCFPCCLQKIEVQAPPGVPIGYITQTWHPFLPKFKIQNEKEEDVLKICGPFFVCNCFGDVDFEIKSLDEQNVVGKIAKQWTGLYREAFTDADNFGIQFPVDLDVKMKAVVLGACFLIDFMFFENCGGMEPIIGVW